MKQSPSSKTNGHQTSGNNNNNKRRTDQDHGSLVRSPPPKQQQPPHQQPHQQVAAPPPPQFAAVVVLLGSAGSVRTSYSAGTRSGGAARVLRPQRQLFLLRGARRRPESVRMVALPPRTQLPQTLCASSSASRCFAYLVFFRSSSPSSPRNSSNLGRVRQQPCGGAEPCGAVAAWSHRSASSFFRTPAAAAAADLVCVRAVLRPAAPGPIGVCLVHFSLID